MLVDDRADERPDIIMTEYTREGQEGRCFARSGRDTRIRGASVERRSNMTASGPYTTFVPVGKT